ncbi:tRNA (N6-threonylcarbamoyladenosine(37)-N6)-methyltransferase TrmO [Candidatus Bathyarchaeota archaeon]|nr:tRNA (N6-threonylcarbamoyladenosine(37)-N6)-methyltransferase TrmO [Candidatus Bathyarchaeota archaeon]
MEIKLKPIGLIHSPYKTKQEMPIQAYASKEVAEIEVFKEYVDGLKDIEGFSHIILLYWFHKSKGYSLHVKPFLDKNFRGIFACRHPNRPNPIGVSTVKLLERRGNILRVEGIDALDGTPLIDIKPYVPKFDERKGAKAGWLDGKL